MPTKNPRITVTLNEEIVEILETLAKERKKSLSQIVRNLLELGLLLSEDMSLVKLTEERLKDFSKEKTLSHEEVWS